MSDLETLGTRNAAFVESFDSGDLPIRPKLQTLILTCMDARVDPAHYVGLELGDAVVLRTAGARATDAAITEVHVLCQLMKLASGQEPQLGLAIIAHTDCGMERFANPQVAAVVGAAIGADVVERYAIGDLEQAVRDDAAKARAEGPAGLSVSGHIYDVRTGELRTVED